MTTIAISGEMSTLSAIKEQIRKINQNLVIEEVEGYAVPSDETIAALKSSESVGVFKSFDEFEKSLENAYRQTSRFV
ncbi:hypothetical protein [Campylobacter sp.]|uniref:hypothetical protein n=1 Tax=Campylobacter sp. TaxID=205 RepID=UPI002A584FDF|nr:hypothetical protein [Campylobacter sp.]MDD7090445.1 hypothetical protein [Campylobacteraceae bacterium]MDY5284722.1 hypothetical protein [Campylobacter sp.]